MEKIPTLFQRNSENMKLVTHEVNPDAAWVLEGQGTPTVKMDGTNIRVTVENGVCTFVEKRRNPTREEKAVGAEPGYVDAHPNDPADKHIFAAVDATNFSRWPDGWLPSIKFKYRNSLGWPDGAWSCEALGPKIQGGAEGVDPMLYPFSLCPFQILVPRENLCSWEGIREVLASAQMEGIVWHHPDGRMAKIKRRDFGLPWPVSKK